MGEQLKCSHCGSTNIESVEVIADGYDKVEKFVCRDCGKTSCLFPEQE